MKSETSPPLDEEVAVAPSSAPRLGFLRGATLSTRLALLFLVASLPALTLVFWTTRDARDQRTEELGRQTTRVSDLVGSEHRRILSTARASLVAIAHLPRVVDHSAGSCNAVLSRILENYKIDYYRVFSNIGVASLDGKVVCSARPPAIPNVSLAGQDFFTEVLHTRDFTVGEFQRDRITDRPSIVFAYPVVTEAGELTGVAVAVLDPTVLAWVADQMLTNLPQGSVFTILDRKGVAIARRPEGDHEPGASPFARTLLAKIRSSVPGTERVTTSQGAVIHAYAPIRNPLGLEEWYTVISIPQRSLYGPLGRSFRDSMLVLALVLAIVLATGWLVAERLVLRPATKILEATRHMAAGNLGVRIGPRYEAGELGELARSFDGMAEALDQRKHELEDNQERLAAMSRRLLAAQEDERRRIARELHDELGQLLTGAKLNLVSLQGGLAAPHPGFDPLDDTLDLVGRALSTVRELSTELRPAILDDSSLGEALEWLLDRVSHRAGFESTFESHLEGVELPPEIESTVFRFVQEALTNVARHAGASNVSVSLRRRGTAIEAIVRDDGVGFYAEAARARSHQGGSLGLVGMEERVTLAGGRLEIESAPGRGTTLCAVIPIARSPEQGWESEAVS